jgi:alkanesulfonate monooxygenase SsuD/methylene tetrahydromethanopterin reductase-like flavin-dependent oxidoreductase (luciferase family)
VVDVLSGGRLELGVGVGWHEAEYRACGVALEERGVVLDHVVGACRALWSEPVASYRSATVSFESLSSMPLPIQHPLPVLFAGSAHARNLERIASTGDGWITIMGAGPDVVADGLDQIEAARAAQGRHGLPFIVRSELAPRFDTRGRPDVDATLALVPPLLAAGVTDVQFPMPCFASDAGGAHRVLERVVDGWRDVSTTPTDPDPEVANP